MLWFVLGGVLLSLALTQFGERLGSRGVVRLALLNPARAMLAAHALLWLLDRALGALGRVAGPPPRAMAVVTLAAMALAGVLSAGALALRREAAQEARAADQTRCSFRFARRAYQSQNVKQLDDALLEAWLRGAPQGDLQVHSTLYEFVRSLATWNAGDHIADKDSPSDTTQVLLSPVMTRHDLTRLPGARRSGALVVLPGGHPVRHRSAGNPGRRTLELSRPLGPADRLLVWLHGRRMVPQGKVRLRLGGRWRPPLDGCHWIGWMEDVPQSGPAPRARDMARLHGEYQGWFLFGPPAGAARGPSATTALLELGLTGGEVERLSVLRY